MSTEKKIKELEASIKKMQQDNLYIIGNSSKRKVSASSDLFKFFIGLVLLSVGLFWVLQTATVSTIFSPFLFGSFSVPSGVVVIPLLIGIVMLFFCERRIYGLIVAVIGILIILLTIIISVRIYFTSTSLFSYILMFGFIAAGCGLLLKTLFRKRD